MKQDERPDINRTGMDDAGRILSEAETVAGGPVNLNAREHTVLMGSGQQPAVVGENAQRTSVSPSRVTRNRRQHDLEPGDVFQGKYEVVRLLGVGGMGEVYEARHRELEATVALKIMSRHLAHQPEAVERFKREARTMARVQHPHAVRVLDAGLEEGCLYLVMEFLEGQTLREWYHGFRRCHLFPPPATVWQYTYEVLSVLEFMHRQQITHRDLKPDNIFLAREADGKETVKVLDFGIAKMRGGGMAGMTVEGLMMGTPGYMSPEQCLGKDVDGRSDLYSMGVILYELLTGKLPFSGDDPIAVAMKHVHEMPPRLRDVNPAILPGVAEVVHRALEKSPEKRFQTAMEFWEAIEHGAMLRNWPRKDPWEGRTGWMADAGSKTGGGGSDVSSPVTPGSDMWQPSRAVATVSKKPDQGTAIHPAGRATQRAEMVSSAGIRKVDEKIFPDPARKRFNIRWDRLFLLLSVLALTGTLVGMLLIKMVGFIGSYVSEAISVEEKSPPPELDGFVFISGGEFVMGRNPGRETVEGVQMAGGKIPDDETPAHVVQVGDVYLSRHETTNAEYRAFVLDTGHTPPMGWKGSDFPPGQESFPVTGVSWADAQDYCAWLTKTRGGGLIFRLPTEAEWEYAARGKDERIFPWGNFWREGMSNTGQAMGKRQTLLLPVNVEPNNTRDRSAMGIMGMGGNVCEWTASEFNVYPGSGYRPAGKDRECRVYRGGHFASPVHEATCTSRKWTLPDRRSEFVGFRVAAEWKRKTEAKK